MCINKGYDSGCKFCEKERLMFITHRTEKYTELDQTRMVLKGGCSWIQLRMKDSLNLETAKAIRQFVYEHNPTKNVLCIDDNLQVALDCHAHAVHLGKNDMPVSMAWEMVREYRMLGTFIVGATANTFEDIKRAVAENASYIGLGPFRFTRTKKNLSPVLGFEGYRKIVQQCREAHYNIPIFAIGGICIEDVASLMETGITGIAVSSAITSAEDPVQETRRFLEEINKY